jgi:hypothetical protein
MNYYFCHHQKTGGRSFIMTVRESNKYNVYNRNKLFENYPNLAENFFISNHYPYSQVELFEQAVTTITFLREPYTRLVSWWNHVQYKNESDQWTPREYHADICNETDFKKIIDNTRFRNTQFNSMTRRLGQYYDFLSFTKKQNYVTMLKQEFSDPTPPTKNDFEKAKDVLETCLIGIQEDYRNSSKYILSHMGIEANEKHIKEPKALNNAMLGHQDMLNELNFYDYELWEYGKKLYNARIKEYNKNF